MPVNSRSQSPSPVPTSGAGEPELVVIARTDAGLRTVAAGVTSNAGAETGSLQARLAAHGAVMRPLFGLSEDRLQAQRAALVAAQPNAEADAERVPDLSRFYRVDAAGDVEQLAEALRADPLIEAAYVKPAGSPPTTTALSTQRINDMQPDAADAPPATSSFV